MQDAEVIKSSQRNPLSYSIAEDFVRITALFAAVSPHSVKKDEAKNPVAEFATAAQTGRPQP